MKVMGSMERTKKFLSRMSGTFQFDKDNPHYVEIFHYILRGLTNEQLDAAGKRLLAGATSSNGFLPKLTPADVRRHAEAAIPTKYDGLHSRKWVWGKDEKMRQLAWHPDMRTPEGDQYPQLTPEEIERAYPKLDPLGKQAAIAEVKRILGVRS
jgi:hypothetical protein